MVPDIVVAGAGEGGPPARLIVLDAKYRIEDGLPDALNSIHTYKDALVRKADGGQIEGLVNAAYLLAPHLPGAAPDYRATPLPGRLFHPENRRSFRFGAVTLQPGMTVADIATALKGVVADAAGA